MSDELPRKFDRNPLGRPLQQELREISNATRINNSDIFLVHITSAGIASQVLNLDPPWLKAYPCKVFGDPRVYFFVMRPLYRLREGDVEQALVSHFPVALVFEAGDIGFPPTHVAPFDTGAAYAGRYDKMHSPGSYLEDYLLEPEISSAEKFILWAYKDMESYFNSQLRKDLNSSISNFHSVAHSWIQIAQASAPNGSSADLRGAAVEVAYDKGISLSGKVKLCIFPDELLQDSRNNTKNQKLIDVIDEHKIAYTTYVWKRGARPNDHLVEINRKLREYFRSLGVLS